LRNSFDNAAREIYFPIFALGPLTRFLPFSNDIRHAHSTVAPWLGTFVQGLAAGSRAAHADE
jgi:hypothetical protein